MTETHSTLQFAERAARIVNHVARVKVSSDDALMNKHMHDVEALRALFEEMRTQNRQLLIRRCLYYIAVRRCRIGPGYCSSRSA